MNPMLFFELRALDRQELVKKSMERRLATYLIFLLTKNVLRNTMEFLNPSL